MSITLSWFFLRSYLFASFIVLTLVSVVVFLGDLVYMVGETSTLSLSTGTVAVLSLLRLPELVLIEMLPIAILIGSTIASLFLIRSKVMLVFESMGGSLWMLLTGPCLAMLCMGMLISLWISPLSTLLYNLHIDIRKTHQQDVTQLGISGNELAMWLYTQHEEFDLVVRLEGLNHMAERIEQGVQILYFDEQQRFVKRIKAESAQISGNTWQMFSAEIEDTLSQNLENRAFVLLTGMPSLKDIETRSEFEEYRLSLFALPNYIAKAREIGFNASFAERRWHILLSLPFLLVSMVLCGLYFTSRMHYRGGGAVQALVTSLIFAIGLFFIQRLFAFLALSGMLTAFLSVWFLPLMIGCCALGLLIKRYESI